ncbi:hypothetical protein [Comamonas sp.]|uniref:hypothetical protein n=1 Tax=Comamonas sp. TaxID=34028 RepID=UPI00289C3A15|nr:hypothetical protein [Comamonas sp.]
MKFRSPTELDMHISLTSGHTTIITAEGNEIPSMFNKEAIARGATPITGEEALAAGVSADGRAQQIQAALQAMVDGSDEGDFTADGKPNLAKVKARLGFAVTRDEVDAAWAIVADAE